MIRTEPFGPATSGLNPQGEGPGAPPPGQLCPGGGAGGRGARPLHHGPDPTAGATATFFLFAPLPLQWGGGKAVEKSPACKGGFGK